MRTLVYVAIVSAAFLPGLAQAAEPTIIVLSPHNLGWAKAACSSALTFAEFGKYYPEMLEGVDECKLVGDGRALGRRLEHEVMSQMAINPQCQGVHVFRLNDPDYDGKSNLSELATQTAAEFY